MSSTQLLQFINEYGFPIISAVGMAYFVYFIWEWTTKQIKPVLSDTNKTLIALVNRIHMLDNDMIRLNIKLSMILELTTLKNGEIDFNELKNLKSVHIPEDLNKKS